MDLETSELHWKLHIELVVSTLNYFAFQVYYYLLLRLTGIFGTGRPALKSQQDFLIKPSSKIRIAYLQIIFIFGAIYDFISASFKSINNVRITFSKEILMKLFFQYFCLLLGGVRAQVPASQCPVGEAYIFCGNSCAENKCCEDGKACDKVTNCPAKCDVRCECLNGHYRDANTGRCVKEHLCTKPAQVISSYLTMIG